MDETRPERTVVYTVGHSNRPLDGFLALLEGFGIAKVVDVRRFPRSRFNPHFNREALAKSLGDRGVVYAHIEALGGRREGRPDSRNTAVENESFRAYADYMETPEFEAALSQVVALAAEKTTAIMCAEAVPWKCHRSLIADALVARGVEVRDILGPGSVREHMLPAFARVVDGRVTYPGESPLF